MFKKIKTLSKKLILAFILVTIISTVSGVLGVVLINVTDQNYSEALISYGFAQGEIGQLGMAINQGQAYIRDIVFLTSDADLKKANEELEQVTADTNDHMAKVEKYCTTPETKALYNTLKDSLAAYRTARAKVVEYGMANNQEKGLKEWEEVARPLVDKTSADAEALLTYLTNAGTKESDRLTLSSLVVSIIMVAVCVVGVIISVVMAIFISKSISKPIKDCADRLQLLADGDLKADVPSVDTQDETLILANATKNIVNTLNTIITDEDYLLGEMANGNFDIKTQAEKSYIGDFSALLQSVRAINHRLSDALNQINTASDQVASGSDQVSSGAQALSQGATEQASAVEELSASITEISDQVRQNAENAANAKNISLTAAGAVEQGNAQMQQMITAMEEISSKSSEIGKIIKTIDDIAFQTNILALNAAVEAARAGAAGKGFAVVADEVRNLAGKSAEAAKSTTALIEDSIRAVENGTHIAGETAKSLSSIVESTSQSTQLIEAIAQASGDQAQSISQVTMGVEQISTVVQTNSATAEESAAASEELSGQAQMLKQLISRFKLANADTSSAELPSSYTPRSHTSHEVYADIGDKY